MPAVAAAAAAAPVSHKRKRSNEPKFYAVRVGHVPGVYYQWDDVMPQIKGFKGAIFKSFPTLTDAEKFVAGQNPRRPGDPPRAVKFYAVKNGRVPGIYTEWDQAQKQIKGWKAPKHRCFATRAEAENWINELDGAETSVTGASLTSPHWPMKQSMDDVDAALAPPAKKSKRQQAASAAPVNVIRNAGNFVPSSLMYDGYEPGMYLPPDSTDGFDKNSVLDEVEPKIWFKNPSQRAATKLQATGLKDGTPIRVYTDGSSLRNGQKGGYAGVGVYFGPNDMRNLSEALPGARQTNQRAELTAIIRALESTPRDRDVVIVTDSEYSINCANKWGRTWRHNGWKATSGKAVENKDLVENILTRIDERKRLRSNTEFEWVKGHANHLGNVEADRLAVNAAKVAASGARA